MTNKESDRDFWARMAELPYDEADRAQLVRRIDELYAEVERLRAALEAIVVQGSDAL